MNQEEKNVKVQLGFEDTQSTLQCSPVDHVPNDDYFDTVNMPCEYCQILTSLPKPYLAYRLLHPVIKMIERIRFNGSKAYALNVLLITL